MKQLFGTTRSRKSLAYGVQARVVSNFSSTCVITPFKTGLNCRDTIETSRGLVEANVMLNREVLQSGCALKQHICYRVSWIQCSSLPSIVHDTSAVESVVVQVALNCPSF